MRYSQNLAIIKVFAPSPQTLKEIRVIVEHTVISAIFILADMLIVRLIGLTVADAVKNIPPGGSPTFVEYFYHGISIASIFVISTRYLLVCFLDINRCRKELISELKPADTNLRSDMQPPQVPIIQEEALKPAAHLNADLYKKVVKSSEDI